MVERGSFTGAAKRLGVQRAAVSKNVRKLEESLGVRLLERSTRAVRPTEAGRLLFAKGRELLEAAGELVDEVQRWTHEVQGELVVAATLELGAAVARHVIPLLRARHPALEVGLALSYDLAELQAEGIDVALRIGDGGSGELVSVPIGELRRGLFASPQYLARFGTPRTALDLRGHELLGFRARPEEPLEWTLSSEGRSCRIPVRGGFSARSYSALLQGVAAGLGITALPSDILAEAIAAEGLTEVLPDWSLPSPPIRAVYPSRRFKPRKLSAFLEVARAHPVFRPAGSS